MYGGKLVAAMDRQHPRDLFDILQLFTHEGITAGIRRAFVVYLAGHNRPVHEVLSPSLRDIRYEYEQNFMGMTIEPVELEGKRLSNPIWQMSFGFETNPGCMRMKASRPDRGANAGARNRSQNWSENSEPADCATFPVDVRRKRYQILFRNIDQLRFGSVDRKERHLFARLKFGASGSVCPHPPNEAIAWDERRLFLERVNTPAQVDVRGYGTQGTGRLFIQESSG